jgi:EAL domain-containing protein (putative c-di-GMP-specific phosphodiesterase class I)
MLDRWVIGSAFAYCESHKQERLFVKLSKDSVTDSTLLDWISTQAKSAQLQPGQLCFQVTEADAAQYLKPLKQLFTELQKLEYYTAIEHFGLGRNSLQLLERLPLHMIKFDGSILQNIETNLPQQEAIKSFVTVAHKRKIETIAERVEQASTMAVLFQLGLDHMQGHYVHEPDVVLEDR